MTDCQHTGPCSCTVVVNPQPPISVTVVPTPGTTPQNPIHVEVGPGQGGARGVQGVQGIQGISGERQEIAYRHVQNTTSSVWNIEHNLGFYPNVTIIDSAGTTCEGELDYIDWNNIRLTFASAFSGTAYLS